MTLSETIKNLFFILIAIQITPVIFKNIRSQYEGVFDKKTAVGVLPIRGVLYNSALYSRQLQTFFKDKNIKAILIKMECPGSAAGTGETIFRELQGLKQEYSKPVVVLVENTCASGGYWIACGADHIIAPGTALIGSVGVALPYMFKLHDFIKEHHIEYKPIKAGAYKLMTDPFVDSTPEDTALLQSVLNDTYQQFTQHVAQRRKLTLSSVQEWADGKIFTGRQAHKMGLIDEIGGPQQAIAAIKEKALIEGEIEWVHPASTETFISRLFKNDEESEDSMMSTFISSVCTQLETRYGSAHVQT